MLGSIALVTVNISHLYPSVREALHHAAFQVSSIMTTTGFATADFNLWPEFSRSLLVLLMVLGACAGSTGGGIKTARLIILFKSVRNEVWKMLHPRLVKLARMDGSILDEAPFTGSTPIWRSTASSSRFPPLLVSFDNFSFETNVTAVFACLNNIGPGLGLVGPMGQLFGFLRFQQAGAHRQHADRKAGNFPDPRAANADHLAARLIRGGRRAPACRAPAFLLSGNRRRTARRAAPPPPGRFRRLWRPRGPLDIPFSRGYNDRDGISD